MKSDPFRAWIVLTARRGAWAPSLVFFIHLVALLGFDAYEHFPPLDLPMHFFGGAAIAYFFHHATLASAASGLTRGTDAVTHWILILALTSTTTVFWEFAEFLSDHFFGSHAQLSLADTMGDMLTGFLGGLSLLLARLVFRARQPRAVPAAKSLEQSWETPAP